MLEETTLLSTLRLLDNLRDNIRDLSFHWKNDYQQLHYTEAELLADQIEIQLKYAKLAEENK